MADETEAAPAVEEAPADAAGEENQAQDAQADADGVGQHEPGVGVDPTPAGPDPDVESVEVPELEVKQFRVTFQPSQVHVVVDAISEDRAVNVARRALADIAAGDAAAAAL